MDDTTNRDDATPPRPFTTADQIATHLGVNINTVRTWFRTGQIPGRKIGHNGWTTPTTTYEEWLNTHPRPAGNYTAAEIAADCGVKTTTVYHWFNHDGLPGTKTRTPTQRGTGTWYTTRETFNRWYTDYLTRKDTP